MLVSAEDTIEVSLSPAAVDFNEHLHNFRVLGRRSVELGGGEAVEAILLSTTAPFDIDAYGDRSSAKMAITDEGECTVTTLLYPMNGWADNPLKFLSEVLVSSLETTLVDGQAVTTGAGTNEQQFKIYTPRNAKLEEEGYPYNENIHFLSEAYVGLSGAAPDVVAKTVPFLDQAISEGELEPIPFELEQELLHEHMYHESWKELWPQRWDRLYKAEMRYLQQCDIYLAEMLEKNEA